MKKDNNQNKNTNVEEAMLALTNASKMLKENTDATVRRLLDESVRETYAKILMESDEDKKKDDDDFEVEEVEDTTEVETPEDDETEGQEEVESTEETVEDETPEEKEDETEGASDTEDEGEDEEWAQFDKFKTENEGEYDFSEAEDEDIVKVYKLLTNDDQIAINKDGEKVEIKDNETGAEYIIDMGGEDTKNEEPETMEESKIFEIALNEYDSNVGYTDNYQKKDVMTNPGMAEPSKSGRDWDKGVPSGDAKPWSGYKGKDKDEADKPFDAGKGKAIEEEEDIDAPIDESVTSVAKQGARRHATKSHAPNNPDQKELGRETSAEGEIKKPTTKAAYTNGAVDESIKRQVNKIYKENRELKKALGEFKKTLSEAAVTNVNLGQIIRLISENSTTRDEKQEIISRFGKDVKTVEESKKLYETISRELKGKEKMSITESAPLSAVNSKQINETKIYQSPEIEKMLDLMDRMKNK